MSKRVEIDDGWYDMHLVRSEDEDENSVWFVWDRNSNGKEFLKGRFQIDDKQHKGTTRSIEMYLTDAAWPSTQKALRTLGWSGSDLMTLDDEDLSIPVRGLIEARYFDGQDGQEIRWEGVKAIGVGGGKIKTKNAMNTDDRRRFAARLMASAQNPAPSASNYGGGDNQSKPDDDLPF